MARHCGHCYGRGHNRRSCPEIKKIIRDNPDGYQARMAQSRAEQAARNPRKCSYCKEPGHNKKTCGKLNQDRKDVALASRVWRRDFMSCARDVGFSLGTLLKFVAHLPENNGSDWKRERIEREVKDHGLFGIVVGFAENMLDKRQKERSYQSVYVRFPSGKTKRKMLPREFLHLMDDYAEPEMVIAAKIDAEKINKLFDWRWHDGIDTADYHCGQGS